VYKRIMVTLDGSKAAEESIPVALALCQKLSAEFFLVQVCEIFAFLKKDREAEETVLKEKATEYLKCIQRLIEPTEINSKSVVLSGRPDVEICEYAIRNNIDLIVMTSHGLGGLAGWAIGSVSEKVVKNANIPVLLVRSKIP